MRKLLTNALKGFTFFLIIYFIIILFFGNLSLNLSNINFVRENPGGTLLRITDIQKIDSLDILFLGSSRSFMGFDTHIFEKRGYKVFNLGSIAQTPTQTKYLFSKYASEIKIKHIIYDVNPSHFVSDGVEATTNLINSDHINLNLLYLVFQINHPKLYNTLIYRFYSQLKGVKLLPETISRSNYYKGYSPSSSLNGTLNIKFKPSLRDFRKEHLISLSETINIFKAKDIPFTLIQTPVTKEYYQSTINNLEFDSIMSSQGKYYNYNNILKMNDSIDFADYQHLNQNGVIKFNKHILDNISLN